MGIHNQFAKLPPILLVIAPNLMACVKTAREFGIEPGLSDGLRTVSQAYKLRGWSRGTPFIAQDRGSWAATRQGHELDMVLDIYVQQGRLRIANERDLLEAGSGLFENGKAAQ